MEGSIFGDFVEQVEGEDDGLISYLVDQNG
jgi:hypothetical protein